MVLYGYTHHIGDQIDCDLIIAPDHYADDPADLAAACLQAVDPQLAEQVRPGDILLAGTQLGSGENPEMAILALQAVGFALIICVSAAVAFVELAEVYGLPVLIAPDAVAAIGPKHLVRVDLERAAIRDQQSEQVFSTKAATPALIAAVRRAQLMTRMRQVVEEEGYDG